MVAEMIGARAACARAPRAFRPPGARVLFACASLVTLFAARPAWCVWQTFGLADGLGDLAVRAVAQDSSENMWFAVANGVNRYDGVGFQNLTPGLLSQDVRAILTDRSGRVWFATGLSSGQVGGVSVFDGSGWVYYTTSNTNNGLASNDVRGLFEDHLSRMWFATGFGASRFDGTNWTSYHQSAGGLASNLLTCIFEDHAGNLWFGSEDSGVSRFDGTTWTTYNNLTTSGRIADNWIRCILETHDGAIWIGSRRGGLSRFDGASWQHITAAGTLADVTGLSEDRYGRLWAATNVGLWRFDGLTWRAYTTADGLVWNDLSALAIDRSGNVWAATVNNGVTRFDGEGWTSFTAVGLGTYGAQALLQDRSGIVWAGTVGGGVARYDGTAWTSLTNASTSGGLASDQVAAVVQDSTGVVWFGTSAGASRFDMAAWTIPPFVASPGGLIGNNVTALARDSSGAIWLGTTTGLSRYDGATWTSYSSAGTRGGLPADGIRSLLVDRDGSLWCGTTGGVGHLKGGTWTTYTNGSTRGGLVGDNVYAILQDHAGAMWFGTSTGLSRFDGVTSWTNYMAPDLGSNGVVSLAETPDSVLWVGTSGQGVSRFDIDRQLWRTYSATDGLVEGTVNAATVDHSGSLWFGTLLGVSLYDPARVPSQTVITAPPPPLSANRLQTVQFAAAFRQIVGIEFSTKFDSQPWSNWGSDNAWVGNGIPDGVHTLQVAARDQLLHQDATPARAVLEVAATPPTPVILSPVFRQPVRDTLVVRGTANAPRFRSMRLDMRPAGASSWDPPVAMTLAQSSVPVIDSTLARLETKGLADGDYELRLAVTDTLSLTGYTTVTYIIDNVPPWAAQTTPALVSALNGGDIWTTNREAHVYVPPRGLPRDAVVRLDPLDPAAVPATLPDGAVRVAPGYAVSMGGVPLDKTAALDLTVTGDVAPQGTSLALYVAGPDNVWRPLGGTLDPAGARISTPFTGPGSYAIFGAPSRASAAAGPLSLTLTPRVLASHGPIASSSVKIGFVLPRSGTVRVTIHNRAGRLVRTVMSGETLGAGATLVSWDGKDEDHRDVDGGLYLVTIEALGETHTQTLGVVR